MNEKKQDFLDAAKGRICIWICESADDREYTVKKIIEKVMKEVDTAYEAGFLAAMQKLNSDQAVKTTEEEKELEVPGVIIVTDDLKKMFPELKNISMIQMRPVSDKTWPEAMEYAKNLKLGGFADWRLPTCSGDEDDETTNNELHGIWRASEALGILVDYRWYWSGAEYSASFAWYVYFGSSGSVYYYGKYNSSYVRCVR
ncbi:DUF1566 domain-containing protein [bacterium]|nr:DUF1566 domain-containing protein [bacterium]